MNKDLLRAVHAIHLGYGIPVEDIFTQIESALATAAAKQFGPLVCSVFRVDRDTGAITSNGFAVKELNRLAIMTFKHRFFQFVRSPKGQ